MQEHFDLEACGIVYKAADGLSIRTILSIEQLKIAQGSRVALQGSSGAGKTTLLKVLSGIIRADAGTVRWGETIVSDLSESRRDLWRGQHCGFLFQDFGLLEGLTAIENVLLPETFTGKITPSARQRARDLLDRFGIRANTPAGHLSRGEMQRTALARMLMGKPKVIFADEPTASLDEANARLVMQALVESSKELRATLFVITHDSDLAQTFPLRAHTCTRDAGSGLRASLLREICHECFFIFERRAAPKQRSLLWFDRAACPGPCRGSFRHSNRTHGQEFDDSSCRSV